MSDKRAGDRFFDDTALETLMSVKIACTVLELIRNVGYFAAMMRPNLGSARSIDQSLTDV